MERQPEKKSPLGKIKLSNAIYPILIGLGVVGYMLWRDFDPAVFAGISFTWHTAFWLLMAVLFMFGRDLGYMIRIRVLSGGSLNWRQAFRVIMLWEFTSAITPSAVGGTSVAILYVHKEGISSASPACLSPLETDSNRFAPPVQTICGTAKPCRRHSLSQYSIWLDGRTTTIRLCGSASANRCTVCISTGRPSLPP